MPLLLTLYKGKCRKEQLLMQRVDGHCRDGEGVDDDVDDDVYIPIYMCTDIDIEI